MARLDRLAAVKGLAQLGAMLGREFSYDLLQAVSPWAEDALQRGLQQLVAAEFLYQQGLPPHATYCFKHALIQDAAYQSLLRSTRQQYHQAIAEVVEARFPELCETQPELLAHHYTEAGLSAQAIPYWQRAGQRALERSAHVEAIAHLAKGLGLLKTFPDIPERTQQELTLQITLGAALRVTKGSVAPEVEQTYARARELCQQVGETPQLFSVLWGLWAFYHGRVALQTARELGEQLLTMAQRVQDPALLLQAHRALGITLRFLGELSAARAHLEQGIALYDVQQHRSLAFLYGGSNPGVACLCYASDLVWALGYPDQALRRSHEALTLAQELSHPLSLVAALVWAAIVHRVRGERQVSQEQVEAMIAPLTELGSPSWLAQATMLGGWGLAERGQEVEGLAQMRQGLTAYRATGAALGLPHFLAWLAEACGSAGQAEEGLHVLAEALSIVESQGQRWWEAELYRLKGELLRARAAEHHTEADTCFRQALEIARRQQAKSLELRAAMSLSRLWQQQGKRDEACELLAPIYGWFSEGFDTADLQEAKALLAEVSR